MSNVLQILSSNYSGKSVNISFTSTLGDTLSFENVSLPYNFVNDTFDGTYTLFFPDYNLTNKFQIPTVPLVNNCRCTKFSYKSFIAGSSKTAYRNCEGSLRKVTLLNGQSFVDCVNPEQITAGTNTNITFYGYCNTNKDCISLTQPPTPTPTPTPSKIPVTPSPTPSITPTRTPSVTPSPTTGILDKCICITITNDKTSQNSVLYYDCSYPTIGNVLISRILGPNGTINVCGVYNSVTGNSVSVSYENGFCKNLNQVLECPEPTPTPSNTPLPICSQTVLLVRTVSAQLCGNDYCRELGYEIWKYNPSNLSEELIYYGLHDSINTETFDISYIFDTNTNTGKVWVSIYSHDIESSVIIEHNIINSNYTISNNLRRITIGEYVLGRSLEFYDSFNLISTIRNSSSPIALDLNFVLININNQGNVIIVPEIIEYIPIPVGGGSADDLLKTSYNTLIYPSRDYMIGYGDINTLWEINLSNGESNYIGFSENVYGSFIGYLYSLFEYDNELYSITAGGEGTNYCRVYKYTSYSGNTNIWDNFYSTLSLNRVRGSSSNPYCNTGTTNILQSN